MLTGCPYKSGVPIDDASVPIDQRLLGAWQDSSVPGSSVYQVEANGSNFYRVRAVSEAQRSDFEGHLSVVDDRTYLNLRELTGDSYWLFWIEVASDGSTLTLHPVTENVTETFGSSDALRAFVAENQHLSFFFGAPTTYIHPTPDLP